MKFVFFDIECACVSKNYAKICAFGYVVCDEKFNILQQEEILINPRGDFHLTGGHGSKGLVLPYEYDSFKQYPKFKAQYAKIKSLLEDKDSYIFGHSTINDVKYLNLETRRYKLPVFNFNFWDTQLIYMTVTGQFEHQFGLEYIANRMSVDYTPHSAVNDAYATMRVLQAICERENSGFSQLVEKYGLCAGSLGKGRIIQPVSTPQKEYVNAKIRKKREISRIRIKFNNFLNTKKPLSCGRLQGKRFIFSREIEDNLSLSKPLVDALYACGGEYHTKLDKCNVYVAAENDQTFRARTAQSSPEIDIINMDELRELING